MLVTVEKPLLARRQTVKPSELDLPEGETILLPSPQVLSRGSRWFAPLPVLR